MPDSKKRVVHTIVGMCILAVIIIAAFIILTKRQERLKDEGIGSGTEADKIIAKDLVNNYPGTPREVLKFYSRITKCFYDSKMSDQQIEGLAGQIRMLFDDELLADNPEDEYLEDLKSEIKEYNEQKKVIVSFIVQKSSSVKKSTIEGRDYATVLAAYMLKQKEDLSKSYEEFMLRQDENGHWKILGWKLVDPNEVDDDELE